MPDPRPISNIFLSSASKLSNIVLEDCGEYLFQISVRSIQLSRGYVNQDGDSQFQKKDLFKGIETNWMKMKTRLSDFSILRAYNTHYNEVEHQVVISLRFLLHYMANT